MLKGLEAVNPRETPHASQFLIIIILKKAAFTGSKQIQNKNCNKDVWVHFEAGSKHTAD